MRSSTPQVEPLEGRLLLTQVVDGINNDLYAVDAKGSLWIYFDGNGPQGPSGWVHEGGSYIDSIAADKFGAGDNSVKIIARTTDGSLFEFDAAAGQSTGTWTNLNKQLASFAVSGYSGYVYGLDSGGTLWYLPVGSPLQAWQSAGAPPVAGNQALASFVLSIRRAYVPHDEIYARTLDGEIARFYFSLSDDPPIWQDLNGNLTNLVTVVGGVAGLDGAGSLWVFDYNDSQWIHAGGSYIAQIASSNDYRGVAQSVAVYVRTTADTVYEFTKDWGTNATAWTDTGLRLASISEPMGENSNYDTFLGIDAQGSLWSTTVFLGNPPSHLGGSGIVAALPPIDTGTTVLFPVLTADGAVYEFVSGDDHGVPTGMGSWKDLNSPLG